MTKWTKEPTERLITVFNTEYYNKFIQYENHSMKLSEFYTEIAKK